LELRRDAERAAYANPRVRGFSQYLLTDDDATGGFQPGLLYATGKRKPAYDAFRFTLDAQLTGTGARKKVAVWGLVRPATAATSVRIERKTRRRFTAWKTLRTTARGAFTATDRFRAGAQYRYRWTAPDGTHTSPPVRATEQ
jgi:hypothetical protein